MVETDSFFDWVYVNSMLGLLNLAWFFIAVQATFRLTYNYGYVISILFFGANFIEAILPEMFDPEVCRNNVISLRIIEIVLIGAVYTIIGQYSTMFGTSMVMGLLLVLLMQTMNILTKFVSTKYIFTC